MAKTELFSTAESVADGFFKNLADPESTARGAKFVWPETYISMCGRFTRVYYKLGNSEAIPEAVAVAVGEQVAKKRAGLPTTVPQEVYRADPSTWVSVALHIGEVVVVDDGGKQTIRFSTQTEALSVNLS